MKKNKVLMWVDRDMKHFFKQKSLDLNVNMIDMKPKHLFKKKRGKRVIADLYEEDLKIKW